MTSKKVRILQYIGNLNIGGSQAMIMELYRNIDRDKIQFDFIVDKKNDLYFADEIRKMGGYIHILPNYIGKNHLEFKKAWNNFFIEHPEYKVIHAHVRSTASIVLKIAKKHGLSTISHSHSTSNGKGISSLVKKVYQYRIRYIADYFMGCSKDSAIWLFGKKIANSNKCFILNNAINTEKFLFNMKIRDQMRKNLNIEDKFVIGHVGRFVTPKNHSFIIDVFNVLQKKNKEAFLLLVGDSSTIKDEIIAKIKSLGIKDKVLVLSDRNDVHELLQAMDTFFMPSLYEGLPVTLIEAQAAGLPVVISDNITDEVMLTPLIEKLSLDRKLDVWVNKLNMKKNIKRKNMKKEIVKAGYDIEKNVLWLTKFYLDIE